MSPSSTRPLTAVFVVLCTISLLSAPALAASTAGSGVSDDGTDGSGVVVGDGLSGGSAVTGATTTSDTGDDSGSDGSSGGNSTAASDSNSTTGSDSNATASDSDGETNGSSNSSNSTTNGDSPFASTGNSSNTSDSTDSGSSDASSSNGSSSRDAGSSGDAESESVSLSRAIRDVNETGLAVVDGTESLESLVETSLETADGGGGVADVPGLYDDGLTFHLSVDESVATTTSVSHSAGVLWTTTDVVDRGTGLLNDAVTIPDLEMETDTADAPSPTTAPPTRLSPGVREADLRRLPEPAGTGSIEGSGAAGSGSAPLPEGSRPATGLALGFGVVAAAAAVRQGAASPLSIGTLGTLSSVVSAGLMPVASVTRGGSSALERLVRLFSPFRYSRYDDSDPLEHEARADVFEVVEESPGVYLSEVAELTALPLSTARHHVRVLEREDVLMGAKVRGKRRFYPAYSGDIELAAAMNDDSTAAVLDALAHLGASSVSDLANELGRDPSTVTHHLQRLEEDGIVVRERDGRAVMNRLSAEARTALEPETGAPEVEAPGAIVGD